MTFSQISADITFSVDLSSDALGTPTLCGVILAARPASSATTCPPQRGQLNVCAFTSYLPRAIEVSCDRIDGTKQIAPRLFR